MKITDLVYVSYLKKLGPNFVVENATEDGFYGCFDTLCEYMYDLGEDGASENDDPYPEVNERTFDSRFTEIETECYNIGDEAGYTRIYVQDKETGKFYMIEFEMFSYSYIYIDDPNIKEVTRQVKEVWV